MPGSTFDQKAPAVMGQLMRDFGLTREQAAGVLGNLGHESGGFRHMQELNPGRGRGGWGWAQWTGSRRKAFEAWAAERGLDPKSDEANYGFLRHELNTTHAGSLRALRGARTAREAMFAFENQFERSGVKAYGSRQSYTDRALRAFDRNGPKGGNGSGFGDAVQGLRRDSSEGFSLPPLGSADDLLRKALRSPIMRGQSVDLKGGANLDITLKGFPPGTSTNSSSEGILKDLNVRRQSAIPQAGVDI